MKYVLFAVITYLVFNTGAFADTYHLIKQGRVVNTIKIKTEDVDAFAAKHGPLVPIKGRSSIGWLYDGAELIEPIEGRKKREEKEAEALSRSQSDAVKSAETAIVGAIDVDKVIDTMDREKLKTIIKWLIKNAK